MVEGGGPRRYVSICFYCIIHSEVPDVSSDILIVDKKNDLNIYKERNQGSGESSCCGTAEKEETASISSCCAPAASCPSTSAEETKLDKADLAKRVANIGESAHAKREVSGDRLSIGKSSRTTAF